ncbi:CD3337/EF1877 family mobilome membrane protein [Enterococcus sp. LJL90]
MQKKKRWVWFWVSVCCICFLGVVLFSLQGQAAEEVQNVAPATTVYEIFDRYATNSFQLLTKEYSSFTGIKAAIVNISGTFKDLMWGLVKFLGLMNVKVAEQLFSMDITSGLKESLSTLSSGLAGTLYNAGTTLGMVAIVVIMVAKFAVEQRFSNVIKTALLGVALVTSLLILSNPTSNRTIMDGLFNISSTVESELIQANPTLNPDDAANYDGLTTGAEKAKKSGEVIAANIFKSSVFDPYLIMNYGTTDVESIRSKTIKIDGESYDRIGVLLDNDSLEDDSTLYDKVVDYESKELKNTTINYKNNWSNAMFCLFYIVLNLIQLLVFFVLAMIRLVFQFMQLILIPILPVMLFVGLFATGLNVLKNYAKGFGLLTLGQAFTILLSIFFTSFISVGYSIASSQSDPFKKILIIVVYVLMPFFIYKFKGFFLLLFSSNRGMAMMFLRHPLQGPKKYKEYQQNQKAQNQKRKDAARDKYQKDDNNPNKQHKYKLQGRNPNQTTGNKPDNERRSSQSRQDPSGSGETQPDGIVRRERKPKEEKTRTPRQQLSRRELSPANRNGERRQPNAASRRLERLHNQSQQQEKVGTANRKNAVLYRKEQARRDQLSANRGDKRAQQRDRIQRSERRPTRSGQRQRITQTTRGPVQRHSGNTHVRAGQHYEAPATPTKSNRRVGTSQVKSAPSTRTRVTRQVTPPTTSKRHVAGKRQAVDAPSKSVRQRTTRPRNTTGR